MGDARSGEVIVICPNCGENNSANFRFCGMCGTSLEPRRPAGAPRTVGASDSSRAPQHAPQYDAVEARVPAKTAVGAVHGSRPTPVRSPGPSFLGLSQPFTEDNGNSSLGNPAGDESLPGLDSFFEHEETGVSARGVIVL